MLYQQLIDSEISVWNRPNVQQMMDWPTSIGKSKATCAESSQDSGQTSMLTSCQTHQRILKRCACFRRPNTGDSADALFKKPQKLMFPQKKTGCTTWIVDPKTHQTRAVQRCFDAISPLEPDLFLGKKFKSKRFLKNSNLFIPFDVS